MYGIGPLIALTATAASAGQSGLSDILRDVERVGVTSELDEDMSRKMNNLPEVFVNASREDQIAYIRGVMNLVAKTGVPAFCDGKETGGAIGGNVAEKLFLDLRSSANAYRTGSIFQEALAGNPAYGATLSAMGQQAGYCARDAPVVIKARDWVHQRR